MSSPTCVAARAAALVLRGQAGVGKTALLDHALNTAHGFAVTRAAGVESEVELPYAALHQLCGRMLDRIERLPPPQADALGVVFGVHVGEPPDRYIVGLATLNLLAEVAADQPLLCVVDDAQWLDQASARTLAFVARRLGAESIALLFGARDPLGVPDLAGLPELVVGGLSDVDSRALLVSVLPGRVDASVVDRVVAEARGNPLALLELPRGLTPADLAGGFPMLRSMSLSGRIEEAFFHRYRALPEQTQLLLLLAAAEPVGDPALLWRAGASLGIGVEDATAAEAEGLVQVGTRVVFRHPLVRSAIYNAGSIHDRQRVHGALGRRDRRGRPRSTGVAPRRLVIRPGRGRRGRPGTRGRACPRPGRRRSRGRVLGTSRRVDARPGAAGTTCTARRGGPQ